MNYLYRALIFIKNLQAKKALFLNSNPEFNKIVENHVVSNHYVCTKWIGGMLTNSLVNFKPDILVVIDPDSQRIAINEANLEKIPIIGIGTTRNDVTFPIPGQSHSFINFCLHWICRVLNTK